MSAWNDFSDREKLEWLRVKVAKIESALVALTRHVDEIGNAVKEFEKKQRDTK